jgi:hypothetical protein
MAIRNEMRTNYYRKIYSSRHYKEEEAERGGGGEEEENVNLCEERL